MICFTSIFYTVSKRKSTRRFYNKLRIKKADKVSFNFFSSSLILNKLNYHYEFTN